MLVEAQSCEGAIVARPYGIRKKTASKKSSSRASEGAALKIKLRGKDDAPLSMQNVREGLYEAIWRLLPFAPPYRAKWVMLYLTLVDEHGDPVVPPDGNTWEINVYRSAADEHGA